MLEISITVPIHIGFSNGDNETRKNHFDRSTTNILDTIVPTYYMFIGFSSNFSIGDGPLVGKGAPAIIRMYPQYCLVE